MAYPCAGPAPPRQDASKAMAIAQVPRMAAHGTSALDAVEGAAELSEELLVLVRRETLLHRVEIGLVQVELRAGQARRAARARPGAGLRAASAVGSGRRQAGEALALAGAQIQVLAARLRPQLGPLRVLQVTGRA